MIDRERPLNQIEAAEEVMRDAYAKASDDGQLPATARQIYYAARPLMLELTGKDTLAYNYFSQTLLLDFMGKHAEECADWDVVWDDRGHFEEPHGGEVIGLGTLSVREYLGRTKNLAISPAGFKDVAIDTCGAHGRFGALLFIEKEGFRDLFKMARARKFCPSASPRRRLDCPSSKSGRMAVASRTLVAAATAQS